jgi:hypothetical protein
MSKSRGRRSKVELETPAITSDVGAALSPPPGPLDQKAKVLWYSILANRPVDFFGVADLPLLFEYVLTVATLLPKANDLIAQDFTPKNLEARDRLVRLAASLAGKLRLHVASRTRADTASMRDSMWRTPAVDWSRV